MLNGLRVLNLPHSFFNESDGPRQAPSLQRLERESFVLHTCQRQLYVSFCQSPFEQLKDQLSKQSLSRDIAYLEGQQAYLFLLETICGLKSRLLGESEIVAQFKQAYSHYVQTELRNPYIMEVLEKLFKDCKEIRSQYLREIGQYSYSGLTKKLLHKNIPKTSDSQRSVAIFGSGQLCHDLLKVLHKKNDLLVCARNRTALAQLQQHYNFEIHPWERREELSLRPALVNTIGAEGLTLFEADFIKKWQQANPQQRVFVDLGSPSVLEDGVHADGLYRLNDLFQATDRLNEQKRQKVEKARDAIWDLTHRRIRSSAIHFPFGWEDLQFA